MNATVVELDQMTQQNAALVEQSVAAAVSLREEPQRLAQLVSTFKLAGLSDNSGQAFRLGARLGRVNQVLLS